MSEAVLDLAGVEVVLDASGAAWLPATRTLLVADLHLETGSAFARRGTLLPPYDTMATLARLDAAVRAFAPATVVSLGDGFHDRQGAASLSPAAFDALKAIMAAARWIWVTGNHDPAPPMALGGAVVPELTLGGLVLRHVPARHHGAEVAGHMHPKARIAGRRLKVSRPCFATDGTRLVMPAFGALTERARPGDDGAVRRPLRRLARGPAQGPPGAARPARARAADVSDGGRRGG